MDKGEVCEAKLGDADKHHNSLTKRRCGAQFVANLSFDFQQIVRQHTLGVVGYNIWILFTIYSSFQWWKIENRLGFDKIITISWVVHVLDHSGYPDNPNFTGRIISLYRYKTRQTTISSATIRWTVMNSLTMRL